MYVSSSSWIQLHNTTYDHSLDSMAMKQFNKVENFEPFFNENLVLGPSCMKTWNCLRLPSCILLLPRQVKTQYLHFRFHANYFLLPWKDSWRNQQTMLFNNWRQYLQYQTCEYNPLPWEWIWPEIAHLMEVSIMINICRYCIFTWYGRLVNKIE